MAFQFKIKPDSSPITITGDFQSFKEAADELRIFLLSQTTEISIPIADTIYPEIHLLLGTGMVDIRTTPQKGIFITGEQQYLDIILVAFNYFESKDTDVKTAVLGPKVQDHYIRQTSDTIALEVI